MIYLRNQLLNKGIKMVVQERATTANTRPAAATGCTEQYISLATGFNMLIHVKNLLLCGHTCTHGMCSQTVVAVDTLLNRFVLAIVPGFYLLYQLLLLLHTFALREWGVAARQHAVRVIE